MFEMATEKSLVLKEKGKAFVIFYFESDDDYKEACALLNPFIAFAQEHDRLPETMYEILPVISEGITDFYQQLLYDEQNIVQSSVNLVKKFCLFYENHSHFPKNLATLAILLEEYFEEEITEEIYVRYL